VVVDARLGEEYGQFIAEFTAELARRRPPDLTGALAVGPGEFTDAERHGALAADAHAIALDAEGPARERVPR
jgi:hypothetical protein